MCARIVLAAVLALGSASGVFADKDRKAMHRHPHVAERAQPAVPVFGPSGARLVTHPAWTFACEAAYGPNRGLPCDIPIWVYGDPCEVGIGWGRSRPCNGR
jgi:hypothetical protein